MSLCIPFNDVQSFSFVMLRTALEGAKQSSLGGVTDMVSVIVHTIDINYPRKSFP